MRKVHWHRISNRAPSKTVVTGCKAVVLRAHRSELGFAQRGNRQAKEHGMQGDCACKCQRTRDVLSFPHLHLWEQSNVCICQAPWSLECSLKRCLPVSKAVSEKSENGSEAKTEDSSLLNLLVVAVCPIGRLTPNAQHSIRGCLYMPASVIACRLCRDFKISSAHLGWGPKIQSDTGLRALQTCTVF